MKLPTAIRFIAILIGVGAIIALIAFAVSLGQKNSGSAAGGAQTNPFTALFPFLGGTKPSAGGAGSTDTGAGQSGPVPRLREITSSPVSGAQFTKNGLVRYVEKETGHIFDVHVDSFESSRISNLTLPGIEHIVWAGDSAFVAQFIANGDSIQNVMAEIATSSPESALTTTLMGPFRGIASSADGGALLTVTPVGDGSRVDSITPGKQPRSVMSSPLRSWVPVIAGRDLMLETAPSSGVPGFLYVIESGGIGGKVVGDVPGLMALPSPDGRYVAYSGASSQGITLSVVDRKNATVYSVPTATLAEKCAWFPSGEPRIFCGIPKNSLATNLDSWLLGLGNFTDDAWIVNPAGGVSNLVLDLANESGVPIDLINPSVSPDGAYAIFQNKTDLSLWALKLFP